MEDHHDDAGAPPSEIDVYLHEESRVLICSVCKGGIQPGPGIESHFRRRHRRNGRWAGGPTDSGDTGRWNVARPRAPAAGRVQLHSMPLLNNKRDGDPAALDREEFGGGRQPWLL
ncbi:uncharacterized protein B0I36DRAFT_356612 [Microdochium trichocladiopsis]|uniref:Uncharacterized protein n=1 Tax=Microdochium trichocladiopsis TaxID=1682393 RepID=A0A9P8XPR7_9PEZI|nr:uncharacterized protein B0I36DRAFT_356612 [Microdochium trichocladiopsis]KAH7009355.1 hypothetical protein B0I36DRAFT_356612 [Microdochium trichocladiopsis]